MRTISASAQSLIQGGVVPHALLVEMQFDGETVYLCSGGVSITHAGHVWQAVGTVGSVEPIVAANRETPGLRFSLSGVPSTQIALALGEPVRNRPVYLYTAWLDPDTGAVLDAPLAWSGTLDQLTLTHEASGAVTIGVSAQHAGATLQRAKPLRYSDADQQRLYPGDTCLRFLPSQANHQDVWPAASWGRK